MHKKKRAIFILLFILVILFVSCDGSLFTSIKQPTPIGDSRFNGTFTYYYYWIDSYGIEEDYERTRYTLDGTNKVKYYTKYYYYSTSTGWLYSGDYIGDSYTFDYEFEIKDGQYRYKLWDNEYSSWCDWEPYEFSSDGETLTLYNIMNISGLNEILTKR